MTALFMTQLVALQEYREFLIDNLLYSILCNPSHKLYKRKRTKENVNPLFLAAPILKEIDIFFWYTDYK